MMSTTAAINTLTEGLGHIDRIQPNSIREPVRQILRSAIEQCHRSRSTLGLPINHALDIAKILAADSADQP